MAALALTNEVKSFIDENISSYEDLQVLLLMHDHPGKNWDALDIAEQLRIEPISASAHLMRLHSRGLLAHDASKGSLYEFAYPSHPEATEEQVSALANAFDRARSEVVDYIFKVSRSQLRFFAEAFDLRKKK